MKKEHIDQLRLIVLDLAEKVHPQWPNDIIHAAAIIAEESGELMQACLNYVYSDGGLKEIEDEAMSVAAMVHRFMLHFPEYYEFVPRYGPDKRFKRKAELVRKKHD